MTMAADRYAVLCRKYLTAVLLHSAPEGLSWGGFKSGYKMNFVRLLPKRPFNLKILFPLSPLTTGRCSDQFLDHDSSLYSRSYSCRKIFSYDKPPISISKRFKFKKTAKEEEFNEELSDDDEEEEDYGDYKLVVANVLSLRTDAILKTGLGLARNKIETYFYESKIRLNGQKIKKKSQKVKIGDEIDVIKGKNQMNESLLNVSRVVLVSVKENEEGDKLRVKLKKYKSLTIEDYSED